jgi:bacteriocin biosynthesis cyclodehydratase domain-containing protein
MHTVATSPTRLNPAARVLWRSATSVQFELGDDAVQVDDIDQPMVSYLLHGPLTTADPCGGPLDKIRDRLRADGYLYDHPHTERRTPPGTELPERLLGELGAVSERAGPHAALARRQLAGRRTCAVVVHGKDRLAPMLGALIAAAGVGWVHMPETGDVRLAQTMPGGLAPGDEGRRLREACGDAVRRAAPDVDTTALPPERRADLLLLTGTAPVELSVRAALHAGGIAHLVVGVDGSRGVVGPLVIPGVTSCLRCVELHRRDRDPAWPALAVQLMSAPGRTAPSDVALCALIAGLAATQALSHLDGEIPSTSGGSLHLTLPGWQVRRRSFGPHPDCDCGAHQ